MKQLLLVLIFWLNTITSPGPALAQAVTVVPVSKDAYLRASKTRIDTKPTLTYPLKKKAGRIVIPTSKGNKVFQDKGVETDDIDQRLFTYEGYMPQLRQHIVYGNYWENSRYLLLDAAGTQTSIASQPEYSPDMRSFVVASADLEVEMMPNEVQLFQLKNGVWRKIWEAQPTTWEPVKVFWTAGNVLFLKKKFWKDGSPTGAYAYSKIIIR